MPLSLVVDNTRADGLEPGRPGLRIIEADEDYAHRAAEILLALESGPMREFALRPIAVAVFGQVHPYVLVTLNGVRTAFTNMEALLLARAVMDEAAFRGSKILARAIRDAGFESAIKAQADQTIQGERRLGLIDDEDLFPDAGRSVGA